MSDYNLQGLGIQAKLCKDILRCVNFAAVKHRDMRRDDESKSPYINHLIDVAYILVNEGGVSDTSVIQAALLHCIVEETGTSLYELHAEFGDSVAGIVKELTADASLSKPEKRQQQIERATQLSYKAKLVLLAKHLNMMREIRRGTPMMWSDESQGYLEWAAQHYAALKNTNTVLEASIDAIFLERGINVS